LPFSQLLPLSAPLPPTHLSLPLPPFRLSLPASPNNLSLPEPPLTRSLPDPAQTVSFPAAAWMLSLPPRPPITSPDGLPLRLSGPVVPTIVAGFPWQVGGSIAMPSGSSSGGPDAIGLNVPDGEMRKMAPLAPGPASSSEMMMSPVGVVTAPN